MISTVTVRAVAQVEREDVKRPLCQEDVMGDVYVVGQGWVGDGVKMSDT